MSKLCKCGNEIPKSLIINGVWRNLRNRARCFECSAFKFNVLEIKYPRKCSEPYKYNWSIVQEYYDEGNSYRDITKKFGASSSTILSAVKRGDLQTRNKSNALKIRREKFPQTHTEETKLKISKARIKYLEENPDKMPYILNHSSKKSYPEILFETALVENNISGFIYNYQNSIYQYDFAFPEIKLDVEIDGGTHLKDKVKKIDERRDKWSREHGWEVLRFTSNEVKLNIKNCIEKLKQTIKKRKND